MKREIFTKATCRTKQECTTCCAEDVQKQEEKAWPVFPSPEIFGSLAPGRKSHSSKSSWTALRRVDRVMGIKERKRQAKPRSI